MIQSNQKTSINSMDQSLPNIIDEQENEINNYTSEDFTINLNINNIHNSQESEQCLETKEGKKKIFQCIYNENLNRFKIFHPGNNEEYPRKLINLILEKKMRTTLSQRNKRKKRKFNSDNIRKKIKSRFLKSLKNTLNQRLKSAGSKFYFNYLPINFVTNTTKIENRGILNMTLKEVYTKNFSENENNEINIHKMKDNILAILYLEKDEIISERCHYKYYKNMKYAEIYEEYLNSREFEEDIIKLKEEQKELEEEESKIYIEKYICIALNLNDFFNENIKKKNVKKMFMK